MHIIQATTRHEDIHTYLAQCVTEDTLAHAYSLYGPRESGKKSLLYAIIPTILGHTVEQSPDFLHIVPDGGEIKIDTIRALKRWIGQTPLRSKKKVAIIESAELMNGESQNALLKSLEEPAPYAHLFLLVGHQRQMLSTIASRTVGLRFNAESKKILAPLAEQVTQLKEVIETSDKSQRVRTWLSYNFSRDEAYTYIQPLVVCMRDRMINETSPVKRKKIAEHITSILSLARSEKRINWHLIIEHALVSL